MMLKLLIGLFIVPTLTSPHETAEPRFKLEPPQTATSREAVFLNGQIVL